MSISLKCSSTILSTRKFDLWNSGGGAFAGPCEKALLEVGGLGLYRLAEDRGRAVERGFLGTFGLLGAGLFGGTVEIFAGPLLTMLSVTFFGVGAGPRVSPFAPPLGGAGSFPLLFALGGDMAAN